MHSPESITQLWSSALGDKRFDSLDAEATLKPETKPPSPGSSTVLEAIVAPGLSSSPGYQLIEVLGQGGMGVVYRARQSSLGREVAIKKVRQPGNRAHADEFLQESLITGRLGHPNVVPVFDLDAKSPGGPALAMKLVDGVPWSDLLHPMSPKLKERARKLGQLGQLGILMQVCNAVAFAHSRGIVHCDLKPANVMIGDFGEVLLMDWGIAIELGQRVERAGPRGTPVYMAPELADGRLNAINQTTDIYLLGAILYEIIAGQPPHRRASLVEVLLSASSSSPPPMPEEAPPELAAICLRATAYAPAQRYASVEDFQEALTAYLSHRESLAITRKAQEILAGCLPRPTRSENPKRRDRLYERFAESVAGFRQAQLLWEDNREAKEGEQEARSRYAEAALASGDIGLAETQASELAAGNKRRAALLAEARELRRQSRAAERRRRTLKRALIGSTSALVLALGAGFIYRRQVNALLAEKTSQIAEKQREAERQSELARRRARELDRAFRLLIEQVRDELSGVTSPEVREARRVILADALRALEGLRRQPLEGEAPSVYEVSALRQLSELSEANGASKEAAERIEEALALARRLIADAPRSDELRLELAQSLLSATRHYARLNRRDDAYRAVLEALAILEGLAAARPSSDRRRILVEAHRRAGDLALIAEERERRYRRSVEEGRALLGSGKGGLRERRAFLSSLSALAQRLADTGKLDEAEAIFDEAYQQVETLRREASLRSGDLQRLLEILLSYADLSQSRGNLTKAASLAEAAALAQGQLTARDPDDIVLQRSLARVLSRLGLFRFLQKKFAEAEDAFQRALAIYRRNAERDSTGSADHVFSVSLLGQLAGIAELRFQPDRALRLYGEALALARPLVRESPNKVGLRSSLVLCLDRCAAIHAAAGRPEQARRLLEEAIGHQGAMVTLRGDTETDRQKLRALEDRLAALPP